MIFSKTVLLIPSSVIVTEEDYSTLVVVSVVVSLVDVELTVVVAVLSVNVVAVAPSAAFYAKIVTIKRERPKVNKMFFIFILLSNVELIINICFIFHFYIK